MLVSTLLELKLVANRHSWDTLCIAVVGAVALAYAQGVGFSYSADFDDSMCRYFSRHHFTYFL